jgi:hypothetical protein
MDARTYLNDCLWGLYGAAISDDDLEQAEAIALVIDGLNRMSGLAAVNLLRELGLMS